MTYLSLTPEDRSIISLMRSVNFGRLENLAVRNGHVVALEGTQKFRTFNFKAKSCHPRVATRPDGDFLLTDLQVNFLETIHSLEDCTISFIKIQAGLPAEMETEGPVDHI